MSVDGTMSCAHCHNPDKRFGYSEGRQIAVGRIAAAGSPLGLIGIRNVPTLLRVRSKLLCDTDGRATLATACIQAITDIRVFGQPSLQAMVDRINSRPRYVQLSQFAFPAPAGFDLYRVQECLVTFVSTIDSPNLPADRLAAGLKVTLPDSARRGWEVFQAWCITCHDPRQDWRDNQFHNIGMSARAGNADLGRGAITGNAADNFHFATPTMVEIAKHGPYMHDGSIRTLEEAVGFFGAGGYYVIGNEIREDPTRDDLVKAIRITATDQADLVNCMKYVFQGEDYREATNPFLPAVVAQ